MRTYRRGVKAGTAVLVLLGSLMVLGPVSPAAASAPVANNDSFTIPAGSSGVFLDVRANDTPSSGTTLQSPVLVAGSPSPGVTVYLGSDDNIYASAPAGSPSQQEVWEYNFTDSSGNQAQGAYISLTVTAPAGTYGGGAQDDTYPGLSSPGVTYDVTNFVLSNDADPYGKPLSIVSAQVPAHYPYQANVVNGHLLVMSPYVEGGTMQITYTVSDGGSYTGTATLRMSFHEFDGIKAKVLRRYKSNHPHRPAIVRVKNVSPWPLKMRMWTLEADRLGKTVLQPGAKFTKKVADGGLQLFFRILASPPIKMEGPCVVNTLVGHLFCD